MKNYINPDLVPTKRKVRRLHPYFNDNLEPSIEKPKPVKKKPSAPAPAKPEPEISDPFNEIMKLGSKEKKHPLKYSDAKPVVINEKPEYQSIQLPRKKNTEVDTDAPRMPRRSL